MKYLKSFEEWCLEEKAYQLLKQYQLGKNDLPASKIGRSVNKEVKFYCETCKKIWCKNLNKIKDLKKTKCPYCAHTKVSNFYNLAVIYPDTINYWDYEKNEKEPNQYMPKSQKKVFWKCNICGNQWKEKIKDRVSSYKVKTKRDIYCPFCAHERVWSQYNLLTEYPEIARQWNYEKNGLLTPMDVFPKSQQEVYWKCDFNPNHVWKDRICNRTVLHRTCQKCAKEFKIGYPAKVIYYYLKQKFPDCLCEMKMGRFSIDLVIPSYKIAIEHDGHYIHKSQEAKNRDNREDEKLQEEGYHVIRLKEVMQKNARIIRKKNIIYYPYTYEYEYLDGLTEYLFQYLNELLHINYTIKPNHEQDNTKIEQLYFHEKKKRTLAVQRPDIAKEWSPQNKQKPDMISCYNSSKVLWFCSQCNKTYSASISNRTQHGSGCTKCSMHKANEGNCLEVTYPEIAKQWDYEKNGKFTPKNVLPKSEKEAYWKCEKGHCWKKAIFLRTEAKDKSCPICKMEKNCLKTKYPQLEQWWDYEKNGFLRPENVSFASNKKVWWKCPNQHSFLYAINKMIRKKEENWCKECKTKIELTHQYKEN